MAQITSVAAAELAAQLDLDVDIGICHACMSFVSMPLSAGDERQAAGATRRITPDLWAEGLAQPARMALRRAREAGLGGAEEALADVDENGPRSVTARAIVRRLASDLAERSDGDLLRMGFQPWPLAELNY
jgi:hypothetical protein